MKLNKPILYKNYIQLFKDNRGFLNPFNIETFLKKKKIEDFALKYQLLSLTQKKNTFRGFHFQKSPYDQIKIIILHTGSILDIVFPYDNLKKSKIKKYNLNAGDILVIPSNYAHGFVTKTSNVLIQYLMNKKYAHTHYTGYSCKDLIIQEKDSKKLIISKNDTNLKKIYFE